MSFSDFKNIADVQRKYKIKYKEKTFILSKEIQLANQFLEDFEFCKQNIDIFTSEASRSEIIISPLLREVYKRHYVKYSFWIQKSIAYDEVLCGTPDYIIATKSELGKTVLERPIIIIVEAKKNDFEQGWGQCLAELVAAQKLNENPLKPVYGIVTDGNLWQFSKLLADEFIKNSENFTIDNLSHLYGALDYIIELSEHE
jgi:hypothetical protein